jgi:predicted ATPase
MKLTLKNIGKIKDSTIDLEGITVICGGNNSGKSTFGKALYCVMNAFCDIAEKGHFAKVKSTEAALNRHLLVPELSGTKIQLYLDLNHLAEMIYEADSKDVASILSSGLETAHYTTRGKFENLLQDVLEIHDISEKELGLSILNRFLTTEFGRKINHVNHPNENGNLLLLMETGVLEIHISQDSAPDYTNNTMIHNKVIFIDSPLSIDALKLNRQQRYETYDHENNLIKRLEHSLNAAIIDEILNKKHLDALMPQINEIVAGDFIEENGELLFQEKGMKQPLELSVLSTGVKLILIIKRLLELGEIKENDVLIFDEPEVHLHPEWQLKFAELLVALQKELNLTLLVNTHSPYFLSAIEQFSTKHGIAQKCKYYTTEEHGDTCDAKDVTADTEPIYAKLAAPFQKLEDMRNGVDE